MLSFASVSAATEIQNFVGLSSAAEKAERDHCHWMLCFESRMHANVANSLIRQ